MPTYILEQTAYSFFGVSPTASPFEIQEAYRRMARKFPADRVWDTPMASVAKMGLQEVERWYANIGSPGARAEYDAMLAAKQRPVEVRQSSDHAVMLDDVVKDCVLKNNSADDDVGQIHAILTKEVERNDDNYHDDNNTKPVLNKDKITKTDFESEEYADSTNEETQCGQGKDEIKDVDSDGSVSSEAAALDAPSYGKDASHSPSATAAGMVMLDQATVLYPNATFPTYSLPNTQVLTIFLACLKTTLSTKRLYDLPTTEKFACTTQTSIP
ncbi:hypothetical protein SBRCBS47491_003444 [Sporothrix bragantina]|uniref:J domain-containing protein n=1 Tax=Sporothrix bragantina TaxID=671064 RepID=A0ABP0BFG0_9PEZI